MTDLLEPFQKRVQPWLLECFGEVIAADKKERNHRFFEEATELVQSLGCTASEAHQLVDYVFGRPVGEPLQETGGVMVTLAALCLANGLDMNVAGEIELGRISVPSMVEKIRAKQAAKPKHSPLPMAVAAPDLAPVAPIGWRDVVQAIHAVDEEAARRGEMFPQTADEQRADRAAVRRVVQMVEWYATRGGAVAEKLASWPSSGSSTPNPVV